MNNWKKAGIALIVITILAIAVYTTHLYSTGATSIASSVFSFVWVLFLTYLSIAGFAGGIVLGVYVFAFFSQFFAKQLKHDPDNDHLYRLFVEVDKNRQVVIERSGNPIRYIIGGKPPTKSMTVKEVRSPILDDWLYKQFRRYEEFIFEATGLYVYVPYFTKPKVIPLPRYNVRPLDGNNVYTVVKELDKGYFTNHVRNALTTWYFEYKKVDIEGIPFTITGSLQYYINPKKVIAALYRTDAWNVLLDQASITVIRSTVRSQSTIDKVVGTTGKEIWEENEKGTSIYTILSQAVLKNLKEHKLEGEETLSDVGIEIVDVLFNDFGPELSVEELLSFRAPALKRQEARGLDLIGTVNADNQAKLKLVHENGGEASEKILAAEALVRASQGNKLFEALLATFVQKNQ